MKLFYLVLLGMLIPLVLAVPPITTQFVGNEGLDIQANIFDYYKINTSAELHIHVFNISNGAIMTNATTECEVELTDSQGTILLEGKPAGYEDHFVMKRNASIVTEIGAYGVILVCNSSYIGGSKTQFFEATSTGNPTPDNLLTFQIGFILLIFCIACFFLFLSIQMQQVGFKIFYMMTSLIFIFATLMSGYMVMVESNVSSNLTTTTLSLVIVFGVIIFIMFISVLIGQTVKALDMLNIKKGFGTPIGSGEKMLGNNFKTY